MIICGDFIPAKHFFNAAERVGVPRGLGLIGISAATANGIRVFNSTHVAGWVAPEVSIDDLFDSALNEKFNRSRSIQKRLVAQGAISAFYVAE